MDILKFNDFIKLENKDLFETISSLFNNNILEQSIVFDHSLVKIFREIGNKNLIAEFLFKTLVNSGNTLDIDGEIKNIEEIYPHPTKADFLEIHYTKPNKTKAKSEMKVGKFINTLVKEMNDRHLKPKPQEIEAFVKLFYAEVSGDVDSLYEFRVVDGDDILKYYDEKQFETPSGSLGASCMKFSGRNKFMQFYSDIGHKKVEMLIRINPTTDKIIGRALVWHLDSGKHYLDRIYVTDNKDVNLFIDYAKKNLKCSWFYDDKKLSPDETVTIPHFEHTQMPFIDTFRYGAGLADGTLVLVAIEVPKIEGMIKTYEFGDINGNFIETPINRSFELNGSIISKVYDGLTLEIIKRDFGWLGKCNFKDAVLGMYKGHIIWCAGTWIDGVWEDGEWNSGTWKNGTWKNGEWGGGTWEDGTWEGGYWKMGTWKNGTWENGEWGGGTWENGTWESGTWESGTWESGTWRDGMWKDGVWETGNWKGGKWIKGEGKPENA